MGAVPLPDGEPASPEPLTAEEITGYVVAAAVWAPSVHNTQPPVVHGQGPRRDLAVTPTLTSRQTGQEANVPIVASFGVSV